MRKHRESKKDPGSNDTPQKWLIAGTRLTESEVKPGSFKPKSGGAKNTGMHTGIYTLNSEGKTETMLIKQGDTVGETVAEFVGGNLYQLTIPDYAAKAYLARPEGISSPSRKDVYVTSVFESEGNTMDAFKAVGYSKRPTLVRVREGIKTRLGLKKETLIRKVLYDDKVNANSSLGFSIANALWHGDHDVHMGNFVKVTHPNDKSKDRYVKIDHGFSFFNLSKRVVDIFNPFAGRKVSFNPMRAIKKEGKIVEFYPFNNFWDLAAEKKDIYFSGAFIQGCEKIISLKPFDIKENITSSLKMVQEMYGDKSDKVLKEFASRMLMNPNKYKNKTGDALVNAISHNMMMRLEKRQKSLKKTVEYCWKNIAMQTHEHHKISRQLDSEIVSLMQQKLRAPDTKESVKIDLKIMFYKLLAQANDLGYLAIDQQGDLALKDKLYLYNSGKRISVTPSEFKTMLKYHRENVSDGTDIKMIAQGLKELKHLVTKEVKASRKTVLPSFQSESAPSKSTWVRGEISPASARRSLKGKGTS